MSEEKAQVRTNADVQRVYHEAEKLKKSREWQMAQHDWTVDKLQTLQAMALPELIAHLQAVVATKVAMDNLNMAYQRKTDNFLDAFNNHVSDLDDKFKQYAHLNQHPGEIAYCRTHNVKSLHTTKPINNRSTKVAKIGTFVSFVAFYILASYNNFLMNWIVTGLPLLLLMIIGMVGFPLLYIAAKFHLPFSQPWAMYHNHRILALGKRIRQSDERYCQENNCDDVSLRRQFKYGESLDANRGLYFEQMSGESDQTKNYLAGYAATLKTHATYFPMDDLQDVRHAFRIYKLLMNGRASSWKEATVLVDEDERIDQLKNTLVDEIRSAKGDIMRAIKQASSEITQAVAATTEAIDGVKSSVDYQTERMEMWNEIQLAVMDYQTDIMKDSNDRINHYYGRAHKYY